MLQHLGRLKRSLTAQIGLAIALISTLLVAGAGMMIIILAGRELREGNELIIFGSLAVLREDLNAPGFDPRRDPQRLVERANLQLGDLHLALLDQDRHPIAVSESFDVPLWALPKQPISAEQLPDAIELADVRKLGKTLGPLTSVWVAPDRRIFRMLLARVPVAAAAGRAPGVYLVAFAYELTQARQLLTRELQVFAVTLLIGALAAALLGVWIARRIVAGPMRLAAAANRISVRPMSERLSVEHTPTELVESTHAFNRMLDRLEASFKRLSEFSSDLAHDLRTPINNLLGEAQVALAKPRAAEEYRCVLESAVEDYERISRLIESMLFLARSDDPHAAIKRQWIDLRPVLERGRGYFDVLAEEAGVALDLEMRGPESTWPQVWADEGLFIRALGNLVSNALRHAPRGTRVVIVAQVHDAGACTVEVSNHGPGIAPEHHLRIFERSFRVDGSRAGSGSGLGLAIVKSIMELHAGSVSVTSAPDRRTTFTLRFPGSAKAS